VLLSSATVSRGALFLDQLSRVIQIRARPCLGRRCCFGFVWKAGAKIRRAEGERSQFRATGPEIGGRRSEASSTIPRYGGGCAKFVARKSAPRSHWSIGASAPSDFASRHGHVSGSLRLWAGKPDRDRACRDFAALTAQTHIPLVHGVIRALTSLARGLEQALPPLLSLPRRIRANGSDRYLAACYAHWEGSIGAREDHFRRLRAIVLRLAANASIRKQSTASCCLSGCGWHGGGGMTRPPVRCDSGSDVAGISG